MKKTDNNPPVSNFIRNIIIEDLKVNKNDGRVITRFPPEPNGYLHIGHAKSIVLNFGIAGEFNGTCHLRFDDTNPAKEEIEYIESIKEDVKWLGYDWGEYLYFASDYFEQLYDYAEELIRRGKAFVCDLSAEKIREYRGTLTEAGKDSPYRDRSIEENLDLFRRMRAGEFPDGSHVLRAKIDMSSGNLNMRDPVIYRIMHMPHPRTGDKWCIYPMYDYTHCLSDSIEGITHSICTLEFEDHRPLYDWVLDQLPVPCHPQQIEFARLNLTYTIMSKRKLMRLVEKGDVNGWDDPRMPTISGMRRRGYPPAAIRTFCEKIGVAKRDSVVDIGLLEYCVRDELNRTADRVMGVLNPLKLVIENYPEGASEELEAINNPEDPSAGMRMVPFSGELYIEREDFMEDPPKKFFRLAPGREVRLRYAYFVTCTGFKKDKNGEVCEVTCTYDPATKGGDSPDGRKVRGTIHWVSAPHAFSAEVRLFDRLFTVPAPEREREGADFREFLNPDSLTVLKECMLEPGLKDAGPAYVCQFERRGYFVADTEDSSKGSPVFNRIVSLRDSWARMEKQRQKQQEQRKNKRKKRKRERGKQKNV